jgi:OPT family small oligopeptide transporter
MAKYLPKRQFTTFGMTWSLNAGPWNAKEHALIVVAYWGSTYTAYGLGPLSAMELYYNKKMNAGWAISFLMTTQLMGYGFAGLYRDVLVRPPQMYYPGVLPNVTLFNTMHKNPSVTASSLKFFCIVAVCTFCYQWFPSFIWPMLSSLPLLCYIGGGNWKIFLMGSGTYGFGLLDLSLDWNYASFFTPLYTPLWANANRFVGVIFTCWILYPIIYFTDTLGAKNFAAMSSGTWDITGAKYNISLVLTPEYTLNQTAMDSYSKPYWSASYAMHFFWGFASSTAVLVYAVLFHGRSSWESVRGAWRNRRADYGDPYLKLMAHLPRVPHWWYIALLAICLVFSITQLYGAEMQLSWWGLILITAISAIFTFPSGILFGSSNMQVGMEYLSELIAGALFPGKPMAVLACMVYGRQVLSQCLNMVGDIKFCFYMKIPERELFFAQVYGTILGPFVNWACMRLIIDSQGPKLTGEVASTAWNALKTKNFYSLSVIWGVLGPKIFFGQDSEYNWICYGFLVGPTAVILIWLAHKWAPHWNIKECINPVVIFHGAAIFPIYTTTNLMTSMIVSVFFMGYVYRCHPVWFRKYNYLLGAGLDCGTQLMQTVMIFAVNLLNVAMPYWWGNNFDAVDRCFPPSGLPENALN